MAAFILGALALLLAGAGLASLVAAHLQLSGIQLPGHLCPAPD